MTASRTPAHVDAHAGAPPPGRWPLPRLVTASAGLHVAALGAAAWVPGAAAAHRLDVTLTAPAKVEPKRRLTVDARIAGAAPGEAAFVTVAAVDEAVELAKSLSTDDSPTFVNGLLGRLLRLKPTLLV